MRWIDSKGGQDPTSIYSNSGFDPLENPNVAGEFWADNINKYKDDPEKRYALAMDQLPLPAGFREAAIALRALIRNKRKAKEDCETELKQLYHLAAIRSFMLDYSTVLQQPGYNIMASIPGGIINELPYSYETLGYEQLDLLNKTDRKWLIDAWGEPKGHTTLNTMHRALWDANEQKVQGSQQSRFRDAITKEASRTGNQRKRQSYKQLAQVIFVLFVIAFIYWVFK